MMQEVSYHPVPAALERHVATLHRGRLPVGRPVRLPALLGQVWFSPAPLWWMPRGAKTPQPLPAMALLGFTSGSFEVLLEADAPIVGMGLWPLGWAELVRQPAHACADRALDAAERWPEQCRQWRAECNDGDAGWGPAVERFALGLQAEARPSADAERIARIDAWLNTEEGPATLSERLGLCPRQTERVTARTHGGSPRLIAGKWRALRAAAELQLNGAEGCDAWARYTDQSQFIREFRRFIGMTPAPYRREETLAKRILADPWHTASRHPLALHHEAQESGEASRLMN